MQSATIVHDHSPAGSQVSTRTSAMRILMGPDVQMSLVLAAVGFHLGSLGVVMVLLAEDLGMAVSSLAWMGSIYGIGLLIAAVLGPTALRHGVHRMLAMCTGLAALGFTLLAMAPTIELVVLGAGMQALGSAGTMLVIPTLLTGPTADIRITRANALASAMGVMSPLLLGAMIAGGMNGRLSLLGAAVPMAVVCAVAALRARTTGHDPAPTIAVGALPGYRNPPISVVARRMLAITLAVAAEFSFVVWAVMRLVEAGLSTGLAATVGAAFPIGMAVGRTGGSWVITHLPAVRVGASLATAGTLLVVVGASWPTIGTGLLLAGLGIATLYPVTLVRLMNAPGLSASAGASLGALSSGTAITLAPAALAALGGMVDLRFAFLAVLPLLATLVLLHGKESRAARTPA